MVFGSSYYIIYSYATMFRPRWPQCWQLLQHGAHRNQLGWGCWPSLPWSFPFWGLAPFASSSPPPANPRI